MKQQLPPDKTEHATSDTKQNKAPAEQEPDTTTQEALILDVQEAGMQMIHFPFGDYEIWP